MDFVDVVLCSFDAKLSSEMKMKCREMIKSSSNSRI